MNQQQYIQTTHCPHCHRCFCGTAKLAAIDGTATCANCKPAYEQRLRDIQAQQAANKQQP